MKHQKSTGNVQFVLDEAAMLGHMQAIDDALGIGRSYRIRLQLYFQSVGQLRQCFPDGREQTLLSNTTQTYFAVNDYATAEQVSNRLGEETIVVDSGGTSRAFTRQWSDSSHSSSGGSDSTTRSRNFNQQARRLLQPSEVLSLPPRAAITFAPGIPPLLTWLIRYYEEPSLVRKPSLPAKMIIEIGSLAISAGACGTLFAFAALVTRAVVRAFHGL